MGNIKIKREMKLSTYLCLIGAAAAGSVENQITTQMELNDMMDKRDLLQNELNAIQDAIELKENDMDIMLADAAGANTTAANSTAPAADSGAANSSNNASNANDSLAPANGTGADNTKGGNGMVIAIVVILAVLGAAGGVWYCKGKGDDKGAENPKE